MATASNAFGSFSIGNIFTRLVANISRDWPLLATIAIGYGLVNLIISVIMTRAILAAMTTQVASGVASPFSFFTSGGYLSTVFFSIFGACFAQCALLVVMLRRDGERGDIGIVLTTALRRLLPYVGMVILWGLGVAIGWTLFMIPGLLLLTIWAAAAPAVVVEGRGPIDALGRSRFLTSGYRWPVFGTLLLVLITYFAVMILIAGLGFGAGFGLGLGRLASSSNALASVSNASLGLNIGQALAGGAMMLLVTGFLAAIYQELVAAKEGGDANALAEIFR